MGHDQCAYWRFLALSDKLFPELEQFIDIRLMSYCTAADIAQITAYMYFVKQDACSSFTDNFNITMEFTKQVLEEKVSTR